jgi:hypothetical protein
VSSPGGASDSLWGSWAVVDLQGRVVHRGSGPLSVSACDPGREQAGQFETGVPPGTYRVDVSVRQGSRGRGVGHLGVRVGSPAPGLAISDLVLICGNAPQLSTAVHIDPDVERRIGRPRSVVTYAELDHLTVGSSGTARFRYTCTVHRLGSREGGESAPVYEATREEDNVGSHRRQFVTIPVASLADGTYEIRIKVRDLGSEAEVTGSTTFAKGDATLADTPR